MREDLKERLNREDLSHDQREFLKSIDVSLEGVIAYAGRLVERYHGNSAEQRPPESKHIAAAT